MALNLETLGIRTAPDPNFALEIAACRGGRLDTWGRPFYFLHPPPISPSHPGLIFTHPPRAIDPLLRPVATKSNGYPRSNGCPDRLSTLCDRPFSQGGAGAGFPVADTKGRQMSCALRVVVGWPVRSWD